MTRKKVEARSTAVTTAKVRALKQGERVRVASLKDYPHASHDADGSLAERWLARQLRGVRLSMSRRGVTGTTVIDANGVAWFVRGVDTMPAIQSAVNQPIQQVTAFASELAGRTEP